MDFQRFAGLEETGEMDEETEEMMAMPRCGVKDMVGHGHRMKRYALQGKECTYLGMLLLLQRGQTCLLPLQAAAGG